MPGSFLHGSWEILAVPDATKSGGTGKVEDRNSVTDAAEKSDVPIVPKKLLNEAGAEEAMEERGATVGNATQTQNTVQPKRIKALLQSGQIPRRSQPYTQRRPSLLEDFTGRNSALMTAVSAHQATATGALWLIDPTTSGTHEPSRSLHFFADTKDMRSRTQTTPKIHSSRRPNVFVFRDRGLRPCAAGSKAEFAEALWRLKAWNSRAASAEPGVPVQAVG